MEATFGMRKEQRIFTRISFRHRVRWTDTHGEENECLIRDVSRGGLSVTLGRYLRPGPNVQFYFDEIDYKNTPVTFPATITWCHPDRTQPGQFYVGFQVVHGKQDTLGAVSEVFYRALAQAHEPQVGTESACCG